MKLYSEYDRGSISMSNDMQLKVLLYELAVDHEIEIIIETGTYNGLGSTTTIANAFANSKHLKKFYTCEVELESFKQAKLNLAKYSFIECCFGSSVDLISAVDFINSDEALNNHESYPDVFIDDVTNPKSFYLKEINGRLIHNKKYGPFSYLFEKRPQQMLLKKLIKKHISDKLFIVLDSAGGIGFLEFTTVVDLLRDYDYYLLLDDIHHLKHFRGFNEINKSPRFQVLGASFKDGWVLARHESNLNFIDS